MKRGIVLFFLVCFCSLPTAFAVTSLGNGFVCDGSSVLKAGKPVSYTKAKSTIARTIAKLKLKLSSAPKKKKPGIKALLKAANLSKTLITSCSKGKLDDSQVDPFFTKLASGTGLYKGSYSGLVGGFIPISGNLSAEFDLQGTVFATVITIEGNVGTALDAKPLNFLGDVGGVGFPAQFFLQGTFLGNVTLEFSQDGHLKITNDDASKRANFEGQISDQGINGSINGAYSGVEYTSTFSLNRVP